MKAFLLFALIIAATCTEPEDAVVIIDVELMSSAIPKMVKLSPYLSLISESYKTANYAEMLDLSFKLFEEAIPVAENFIESITFKPENMQQDLRGDINVNIGGFHFPCLNVCFNWGKGIYQCKCK